MKSMHTLLDEAEKNWREEVRKDYPLRADTPVVRKKEGDNKDWSFSTDLKKIYATISRDEALQKNFKTVVSKYWDGTPEELARATLHYLLYHELFHPLEAPFSITGPDNDNKKIHQAIRKGILKAELKLRPLEQIVKVHASQNGVKDFILDNRFYLENLEKKYVQTDIVPTWDVLELQEAEPKTNFYTITRLLYGVLYGPEKTHPFFKKKAGRTGTKIAEQALSALIQEKVALPKRKAKLVTKIKSALGILKEKPNVEEYVQKIRTVFSGEDRYKGIERFMTLLGPYVEQGMPQARPDLAEEAGASPQNILQDLLDDMTPQEQQNFVQGLNQEGQETLDQTANQMNTETVQDNTPSRNQMQHLDLLASHEFYKRNHPEVKIRGEKKTGESVVVGKKEYWALKKSSILTEDQLSKINLNRIETLQRKSRLPWLIHLGNGTYKLDEYDIKEKTVKDLVYKDLDLDVPEVVEFYLDSSGSMFRGTAGTYHVNDGTSWDMLSYVLYGFTDGLLQAGQRLQKKTKLRFHNFADQQISSQLVTAEHFWQGDIETLKTIFKPENGYNVEDLDIAHYADRQRRTYVIVTDGNLVLDGRTAREAEKMRQIAKQPHTNVALFEIGGTYSLGKAIQKDPNISYYQVHDKQEMLQAGLEVLLTK